MMNQEQFERFKFLNTDLEMKCIVYGRIDYRYNTAEASHREILKKLRDEAYANWGHASKELYGFMESLKVQND